MEDFKVSFLPPNMIWKMADPNEPEPDELEIGGLRELSRISLLSPFIHTSLRWLRAKNVEWCVSDTSFSGNVSSSHGRCLQWWILKLPNVVGYLYFNKQGLLPRSILPSVSDTIFCMGRIRPWPAQISAIIALCPIASGCMIASSCCPPNQPLIGRSGSYIFAPISRPTPIWPSYGPDSPAPPWLILSRRA